MDIKEVINKIRFRMRDVDEVKHSDHEIVLAINDGVRMYHDLCFEHDPDLITNHFENTTVNFFAYVPYDAVKVTHVRCEGRIIHAATMNDIETVNQKGQPKYYVPRMTNGRLVLLLFPKPQKEVRYSVDYIRSVEEVKADDYLMFSTDVINCIIDYAVAALNGGDTEGAVVSMSKLIKDIVPSPCVVESYY